MTALLRALGMFTVIPVRHRAAPPLRAGDGATALLWLPAVGAALGAVAALPATAIRHWAPHAGLLGAVCALVLLAGLTRCLHLDGLADTADGLGSRAEPERARAIMRQSDIGPFGVVAIVLVVAVDVAALGVLRMGVWGPVGAFAVAAATGRLAAVQAAVRGVDPAPGSGFGVLVAGGLAPVAVGLATVLVLAFGAVVALLLSVSAAWFVVAQVVALLAAFLLRRHVVRRIGGISGDVFGALIETATALTLAGVALR